MILRSAALLTFALGLRIMLTVLPALGGALVLPLDAVADVTLSLAIVTPFFLASAMGIPQRVSTGDYGASRYDQLQVARAILGVAALPIILLLGLAFPMVGSLMILAFFVTRLLEGQAEISAAILANRDRAIFIASTYGILVVAYCVGLLLISTLSEGRVEVLLALTVATATLAMIALHLGAVRYHDRIGIRGRLLSRSLFEIRKGYSLGMADGVLSLVSYLPRYLLSAIGLHLVQGAFSIAQLLIRQFTIPTQGLLFARGGHLLPHKASDHRQVDRFLAVAFVMAMSIALGFVLLYELVRDREWYTPLILSQLDRGEMLFSILVGAVFLLRFATWVLATRFLRGADQLRIALWSAGAAVGTAILLFVSPTFEIALATDIVANLVIILLGRRAIVRKAARP